MRDTRKKFKLYNTQHYICYLLTDLNKNFKTESYVGMNPIKHRKSASVKQEHSSLYEEINLNTKVSFVSFC